MPRKIWLVMTPELPRAPMSAPKLMAAATRSAGWPGDRLGLVERRLAPWRACSSPVSPSGTGIDVEAVDLVDVGLEVGDRRAERVEQAVAVAGATGHLGDVRPAVREVARPDRRRVRPARACGHAPRLAGRAGRRCG